MQQPNVRSAGQTFSFSESALKPKKRLSLFMKDSPSPSGSVSLLFAAAEGVSPEARAVFAAVLAVPAAAAAAAVPAAPAFACASALTTKIDVSSEKPFSAAACISFSAICERLLESRIMPQMLSSSTALQNALLHITCLLYTSPSGDVYKRQVLPPPRNNMAPAAFPPAICPNTASVYSFSDAGPPSLP